MSAIRLTPDSLRQYQEALREVGVDGWLFYDFRGINPVAGELIGIGGFITRRIFVWVPATSTPVAVTHAIEQTVWSGWPTAWKFGMAFGSRVLKTQVEHGDWTGTAEARPLTASLSPHQRHKLLRSCL